MERSTTFLAHRATWPTRAILGLGVLMCLLAYLCHRRERPGRPRGTDEQSSVRLQLLAVSRACAKLNEEYSIALREETAAQIECDKAHLASDKAGFGGLRLASARLRLAIRQVRTKHVNEQLDRNLAAMSRYTEEYIRSFGTSPSQPCISLGEARVGPQPD